MVESKIYLIGPGEAGPLKIGFTTQSLERRVMTLQPGYPGRLYAFGGFDCNWAWRAEVMVHNMLKKHCIFGEWFAVSVGAASAAIHEAISLCGPTPDDDTLAGRRRAEMKRKLRAAAPLWRLPSSQMSAAKVGEVVGIKAAVLYNYLGTRESFRNRYSTE